MLEAAAWYGAFVNGAQAMHIDPSSEADELLTERQTAELLNISTRTLQAWRSDSVGPPFIRVGRTIRYRRGALVAWMEANTVRPESAR